MREIKYRAWDKNKKIMIDANNPYVNQFIAGTIASAFTELQEDNHPYIFMQYTELKDKNDVEIYEGDIIKPLGIKPHIVEFINGSFETVFIEDKTKLMKLFDYGNKVEIIGNIYQNKELLD